VSFIGIKADSSFLRNDGMIDSSLMERLDEKEKHFIKLTKKTRNHCNIRCGAWRRCGAVVVASPVATGGLFEPQQQRTFNLTWQSKYYDEVHYFLCTMLFSHNDVSLIFSPSKMSSHSYCPYVCLLHAFIHLEYSSIFQNLFNNLESILIPCSGPDKKQRVFLYSQGA